MPFKDFRTFGYLFRKFRLKAGYATLIELGEALAKEGIVVEDSTLSRWQNGSRTPKTRQILLQLIKILHDHEGIESITEANLLMETTGLGYLTDSEIKQLSLTPNSTVNNFQVPAD